MNTYICPVCGDDGLEEEAYGKNFNPSYEICSCCGFEFGYSEDHDVRLGYYVVPNEMKAAAFQLYRKQWVETGAQIAHPDYFSKENQENGKLKRDIMLKQFTRLKLPVDNFDFLDD